MKLHICCGDVYLKGYLNTDIKGEKLKSLYCPNETTLENYYQDDFQKERKRKPYIYDQYLDILKSPWPCPCSVIDEIVMISAIEHFNKVEARYILNEIKRVLRPRGRLVIDFPDLKEQINQYYESDPDFCMELIYCNQKDSESQHKWGYSEASFEEALGNGWDSIEFKTIVQHDYPMIGCVAIRGNDNV